MTDQLLKLLKQDEAPNPEPLPSYKPVGPSGASSSRLVIVDINHDPTSGPNKLLYAVEAKGDALLTVELAGAWATTQVGIGHIFRVVLTSSEGDFTAWRNSEWEQKTVRVDDEFNFFIHHPDTLIAGTSVADSYFCLRKAVIATKTPEPMDYTTIGGEAALFGSMIHELFQNVLILDSNIRDYSTSEELTQVGGIDHMAFFEAVEDVLYNHADDLYASKNEPAFARKLLHKVIPQISEWYRNFMGEGNFHNTEGVDIKFGRSEVRKVVVSKVHDIEELVWSPVLGLKGKIDASVFLRIEGYDSGIAVLELKTGKASGYSGLSHGAQVGLYNLLLSDRKNTTIRHGLLSYISFAEALEALRKEELAAPNQQQGNDRGESNAMRHKRRKIYELVKNKMVSSTRGELIGLIMQRNSLAVHLRLDADVEDLPYLYQGDPGKCTSCFVRKSCLIQHKLLQNGSTEHDEVKNGPGSDLYQTTTQHLTEEHANYYKFWREAVADEEQVSLQDTRDIWTVPSTKREEKRLSLGNLVLASSETGGQEMSPHALLSPGQRIVAEFRRQKGFTEKNLLNSGLREGEYIMISAERRWKKEHNKWEKLDGLVTWQSGLSSGIIQSVTSKAVFVSVERSLTAWVYHQDVELDQVQWRLDALELVSSYKTAKQTLEVIFYEGDEMARLRALVVDREAPMFESSSEKEPFDSTGNSFGDIQLNDEQREAVRRSHLAKDYLLVLGMPGTGKSETLAAIVLTWAQRGKTILLCSHTNAAVDNLLERLLDNDFDNFVRVGRQGKVISERIQPYHISSLYSVVGASRTEVDSVVDKKAVIATTCLSIHHAAVQRRRRFDLVVVDEASQVSQPICLGPLTKCAGPFVLVGDHYQLPPLQRASVGVGPRMTRRASVSTVQLQMSPNTDAECDDVPDVHTQLEESLFRRLCERHRDAMVVLKRQYRMAGDIAWLCNELVYGGSLQCGLESVRHRKLAISDEQGSNSRYTGWRAAIADAERRVVLVDVNSHARAGEASVAAEATHVLISRGVTTRDVAVLSPFRAQVAAVADKLQQIGVTGVETSTIDRYQGRDCASIVISLAAGERAHEHALLRDWRRINVALTRAKAKLVLVCAANAARKAGPLLNELVAAVERRGWMVRCEADDECLRNVASSAKSGRVATGVDDSTATDGIKTPKGQGVQ